jgi:hypothetical protein
MLSHLLCRTCHGLVYQSQNCGDNRWYRETARPLSDWYKKNANSWQNSPALAPLPASLRSTTKFARYDRSCGAELNSESGNFAPGFYLANGVPIEI